jgi:hypothetical protein
MAVPANEPMDSAATAAAVVMVRMRMGMRPFCGEIPRWMFTV